MVNKLNCLKFEISFLSGFPFSKEKSVATFALSWKTLFSMLDFTVVVRNEAKNSDAILMSLGGIVTVPTAILVSNPFRSFQLSQLLLI